MPETDVKIEIVEDPLRDDLIERPARPDFDLVARVRRIDSKLYSMRLYRVTRAKDDKADDLLGMIMFRADEWARVVPALRAADITIDYV